MGRFHDEAAVYRTIGAMFDEAVADPVIGPELAASGVILRIEMQDPTAVISVDLPGRTVETGTGSLLRPTMTIKGRADDLHSYWMGDLNVGVAIARGLIRVRGPVPTLLKLAGAAKPLFPRYRALIERTGA